MTILTVETQGFTWDYEEDSSTPHYHIYGDIEWVDGSICLDIPMTKENTKDVQAIVDALSRIEKRINE